MNEDPNDMRDDYLWDRSGPVDGEVARLERLLGGLAHRDAGPRTAVAPPRRFRVRRPRWRSVLAAAAVLAACAIGVRGWYEHRLEWEAGRPWQLSALRGEVRIDGVAVGDDDAGLAPRGWLETGPGALARLRAAGIGEVAIGAQSRVRLLETRTGRHRMRLQQGSLWARVWAPPGQFGVRAPDLEVIDLGCEFMMRVDAQGNGTLSVRSGWVQVEARGREVLVPEGTRVRLRADGVPGTPHRADAGPEFVAALEAIDALDGQVAPDGLEIRRLLAAARPGDAISLLSLLQVHPRLGAGPMFEAMQAALPQVPASRARWGADHDAVLDAWRHALPYPRIKRWWTQWPDALPWTAPEVDVLLHPGTG